MSYRLTKIYTRTGDDGKTNFGRTRLPKNHPKIIALSALDELNCVLGIILIQEHLITDVTSCLKQIQNDLFDIGGEIYAPENPVITAENVISLEKLIDKWNENLEPLKEFLLPGGNAASAHCHLARAICRRAETNLVTLFESESFNPEILRFINRLSDLLFVAARRLARESHLPEEIWQH